MPQRRLNGSTHLLIPADLCEAPAKLQKKGGEQMHKVYGILVGICVVLVSVGVESSEAIGLGLYGRYGTSTLEVDYNNNPDMDLGRSSIGLVLDTAVAKRSVFNYRLELGYTTLTGDTDDGLEFDLTGGEMNHTFGFSVLKARSTRLWMGPTLRFAAGSGTVTSSQTSFLGASSTSEADGTFTSAGLGLALGGNHHLGNVASLCWMLDYVYQYGSAEEDERSAWSDYEYSGGGISGSLAFIFLLGGESHR
jgi:hypothetical protein